MAPEREPGPIKAEVVVHLPELLVRVPTGGNYATRG